MVYYTATRGVIKSPEYRYFNTIEELNSFYGLDSNEDDYNKGFTFEYEGNVYLLGSE